MRYALERRHAILIAGERGSCRLTARECSAPDRRCLRCNAGRKSVCADYRCCAVRLQAFTSMPLRQAAEPPTDCRRSDRGKISGVCVVHDAVGNEAVCDRIAPCNQGKIQGKWRNVGEFGARAHPNTLEGLMKFRKFPKRRNREILQFQQGIPTQDEGTRKPMLLFSFGFRDTC